MRKIFAPAVLVLYSVFLVWGIMKVPFHPDESSLLYQSRDLESLFTAPRSLAWDPTKNDDVDQQYRALNAPLGKYILGLGRRLFGFGPSSVAVDWDWTKSWRENASMGALPEDKLLLGGRLAVTLLLPLSLVMMYLSGKQLGGRLTGVLAAMLFGINTLILLHNRRAMSEGVLTVCLCLSILGMLTAHRAPLLAGLGASLAFSAKYSVAPMLLANLIASVWLPSNIKHEPKRVLKNLGAYLLIAAVVILALNPFLWSNPLQASVQLWDTRQDLLTRQVESLRALLPAQVLDTYPKKLAVMIGHLFLTPPQCAEVGNYLTQTSQAERAYMTNPFHHLFRGNLWGGMMLVLALFGLILGISRLASTTNTEQRRKLSLLAIATIFQTIAMLIAIPLPFQRYYIPLIPFINLWTAFGLTQLSTHKNAG